MIANTNDNIRLDQICIKYQFGLGRSPTFLHQSVVVVISDVSLPWYLEVQ